MKCPVCAGFVQLERMNFIYQETKNIRVKTTYECNNGHTFKAKEKKAVAKTNPRRKKEGLQSTIRRNRDLVQG